MTGQKGIGLHSDSYPDSQKHVIRTVISEIRDVLPAVVLDLGCGSGYLCGKLLDMGCNVTGVDADSRKISDAREMYPGCNFVRADIEELSPADFSRPYDVVLATEVLEHLYSPHRLVKLTRGVLRDEGIIVLSTPYHGYLKNLVIALLNKWDDHHNPVRRGGHIKFW